MSIESLPKDILCHFSQFVPAVTISRMRRVCKAWNESLSEDSARTNPIWSKLCHAAGFQQLLDEDINAGTTFRRHFLNSMEQIPGLPYFNPVYQPLYRKTSPSQEVLIEQAFESDQEVALYKIVVRGAPADRSRKAKRAKTDSRISRYIPTVQNHIYQAANFNYNRFLALVFKDPRFEDYWTEAKIKIVFERVSSHANQLQLVLDSLKIGHIASRLPMFALAEATFFAAACMHEPTLRVILDDNHAIMTEKFTPTTLSTLNKTPRSNFWAIMQVFAPLIQSRLDDDPECNRLDLHEILLRTPNLHPFLPIFKLAIAFTVAVQERHLGFITQILRYPGLNPYIMQSGLERAIHYKDSPVAEQILARESELRLLSRVSIRVFIYRAEQAGMTDVKDRLIQLLIN